MKFDLVHRGDDIGFGEETLKVVRVEVTDPDRPHAGIGLKTLEIMPGVDAPVLLSGGPMDEVQVEDVEPERIHTVVECAECPVEPVVCVPDRRSYEELVPADARTTDSLADGFLVGVKGCCVDMAVSGVDGRCHNVRRDAGSHVVDTQSELRNGVAVTQCRTRKCGCNGFIFAVWKD